MKKTWRKLGITVIAFAVLMTAACAGSDLSVGSPGDDQILDDHSSLTFDTPEEILGMFDSLEGEETDSISQVDSFGFDGDLIALDDLGISITVKDYYLVKQDEYGYVIVFTEGEYIPLVMIKYFETGWDVLPTNFSDMFLEVMLEDLPDTRQTEDPYTVTLSGREFLHLRYEYAIQGYTTTDNRYFCQWNNRTYMFVGREIFSRGDMLPDHFLEQIAASMAPLAGGEADYENHVDSTRVVKGPGPSAGQAGGYNPETGTGGTTGQTGGSTGGSSSDQGPSVGSPVGSGGPVGREPAGGSAGTITFDETMADYQGVWVEFSDGFKLYLPTGWNTYNLTQDQYDRGIFYMAGDTSGSAAPAGIGVSYGEKGDLTLEQIAQMMQQEGCEVDGVITVNGMSCVSYVSEEEDCCGLIFFHPEGLDYFFMVEAFNYSGSVDTLTAVICSLTPTV